MLICCCSSFELVNLLFLFYGQITALCLAGMMFCLSPYASCTCGTAAGRGQPRQGHSVHGLLIKMLVLIFGMLTVGTILLYILKKGNDNYLSAAGEAEEAADCKGATS